MTKPLFIWAGGKNKMLKHYIPLMPDQNIETYSEPFFGGGAMLLYVIERYNPKEIWINDINQGLMSIYTHIRDNKEEFCSILDEYTNQYLPLSKEDRKKFYYDLREENAWHYQDWGEVKESAVLYFLMKTGFNGIWQINKNTNNRYGTPAGLLNQKDKVYDKDIVDYWHKMMNERKTHLMCGDWSEVPVCDFTYYDPPYRGSFADYNQPFPDEECEKLIANVENNTNVWLANRDIGDGFFDDRNASCKKFPITYTAGRRKKTEDGHEAKKATEILLYRSSNKTIEDFFS